MIELDLRDLSAFSTVTPAVLVACSEAASAMLWRFTSPPLSVAYGSWQHGPPLIRSSANPVEVCVIWNQPDEDVLRSHGNEKDATEDGAYAVAIAIANQLGFKVIARSHQGSGTDWLMIRKGEPANDFYKLEVSGIARVKKEKPEARLGNKVAQGSGGDLRRPGVAVVARFEDLRIVSEAWV